MRLESVLLAKGARSVVVTPGSMFSGRRCSRTAPPFRSLRRRPRSAHLGRRSPAVRHLQMKMYGRGGGAMGLELNGRAYM